MLLVVFLRVMVFLDSGVVDNVVSAVEDFLDDLLEGDVDISL